MPTAKRPSTAVFWRVSFDCTGPADYYQGFGVLGFEIRSNVDPPAYTPVSPDTVAYPVPRAFFCFVFALESSVLVPALVIGLI